MAGGEIKRRLADSRHRLKTELEEFGFQDVLLRRVASMAESGDLAILELVLMKRSRDVGNVLLSPISAQEVDLARGQLIAIRELWLDLELLDSDDESEREFDRSHNIFEHLSDEDEQDSRFEIGS